MKMEKCAPAMRDASLIWCDANLNLISCYLEIPLGRPCCPPCCVSGQAQRRPRANCVVLALLATRTDQQVSELALLEQAPRIRAERT